MDDIYIKYCKCVYNFLYKLTNDIELSEELTQETFYTAIKKINTLKNKESIRTWLYQIAKNKWKDYLKKNKKHNIDLDNNELENLAENYDIEEDMIAKDNIIEFYKKIHRLDVDTREIIYLRIIRNFTFKEISQILGKNEEWARAKFCRGKLKLKESYKNECDIVKDLLPSYAVELLSNNTNQFVQEHLDSCQECRKLYEGMKKMNYNKETDEKLEINHLKKYSRHMLILKILLIILVLIIITLPLFFIIKLNLNNEVANKAINNINEYRNANNYILQITENSIDYERNTEQFFNSKYFYKDGKYKKEMHSENSKDNIQNSDRFEFGEINSNEKVEIIENLKVCYNIKANYILRKKDGFLDFMMIALQPFSEDYGTLPNIWFQAGYNLRTDKYNGRKCYVVKIDSKSSYREIWIDKERNTLVRTVEEIYNRSYREKVYSIKSDVVTNEDVALPDITDYTIKNGENSIPDEYIEIYEKLGI